MNDILDPDYCPDAAEYERLVRSGRRHEAEKFAANKVREGSLSKRMSEIVADIVDPDVKRGRGRPRGSPLNELWHNIGRDHADMVAAGIPAGKAYDALADEYGREKRTIENIVRDYRETMREAYEDIEGWNGDFASWPDEEKAQWHREIEQAERDAVEDALPSTETSEIDDDDVWVRHALSSCRQGYENGCHRSKLLTERHLCPFSGSPRNKIGI